LIRRTSNDSVNHVNSPRIDTDATDFTDESVKIRKNPSHPCQSVMN
jgi:hypothetical protein